MSYNSVRDWRLLCRKEKCERRSQERTKLVVTLGLDPRPSGDKGSWFGNWLVPSRHCPLSICNLLVRVTPIVWLHYIGRLLCVAAPVLALVVRWWLDGSECMWCPFVSCVDLICGRQCRDLNALPFCCTPLHCIGSRGLLEIDVLALCYCRVWRARPRPRPASQFFELH